MEAFLVTMIMDLVHTIMGAHGIGVHLWLLKWVENFSRDLARRDLYDYSNSFQYLSSADVSSSDIRGPSDSFWCGSSNSATKYLNASTEGLREMFSQPLSGQLFYCCFFSLWYFRKYYPVKIWPSTGFHSGIIYIYI